MSWFRLDDQGAFHAKVVQAGNEAYGAWCRAGQWSSAHLTEGRLPRTTALAIAPIKIWKRLVEARGTSKHGLLEETGTDFQIHDYLDYNPSAEEELAKRAARSAAGRNGGNKTAAKKAARAQATVQAIAPAFAQAIAPAFAQANGQQTSAPFPSPSPIPKRSEIPGSVVREPEKPRISRFEEPFWRSSYAEVVAARLGGKWGFPDKQLSAIRRSVEAHCTHLADIDGWLRAAVAAFVDATRDRSGFYAGLGPDGLLKWLNELAAAGNPFVRPTSAPLATKVAPNEPTDYAPPTPEEAAELEQALADMLASPKASAPVRERDEPLAPDELERLEAKRRADVARLRAFDAGDASNPAGLDARER